MNEYKYRVTKRQAERVLALTRRWFCENGYADSGLPQLYKPGHHQTGWTIALEGGPFEWPILACAGGFDDNGFRTSSIENIPMALRLEPNNGWSFSIYEA